MVYGRWPADEATAREVGGEFDLILSKNTLKRGYVHPEREVDERMTISLGVDDETFVRRMYESLRLGGLVMIYNICPKQNPPDEAYIPWADGRCPFDRALVEAVGFEVLKFDEDDSAVIRDWWMRLGLNRGQSREELAGDLFGHYTLLRRPVS
jgi:hypothetical protein